MMFKLLEPALPEIPKINTGDLTGKVEWAPILRNATRNIPRHIESFDYAVMMWMNLNSWRSDDPHNEKFTDALKLKAFRDGARSFYVVREDMQAIRNAITNLSPSLFTAAHVDKAVEWVDDYESVFKQGIGCRNIASHTSELGDTPTKQRTNSISKPGVYQGGIWVMGQNNSIVFREAINGNKYFGSYKNRMYEYELSQSTSHKLKSYLQSYFAWLRDIIIECNAEREQNPGNVV